MLVQRARRFMVVSWPEHETNSHMPKLDFTAAPRAHSIGSGANFKASDDHNLHFFVIICIKSAESAGMACSGVLSAIPFVGIYL